MDSGRHDLAYPKSQVDSPLFTLFYACGGSGSTNCPTTMGVTQYVYSTRVPKFVVFNRSLIFDNGTYSPGVTIYSDGGSDAFCSHTLSVRQDFWVALSANGVLTDAQVMARGVHVAGSNIPPYNIQFDWNKIPQPKDAGWQNKIFIHIVWASTLYVTRNAMHDDILTLTKHDYDIKQ